MTEIAALVLPDRVHGSVYAAQDIFDREMEMIFGNGWVYIGCDGEIPKAGDFRQRSIGCQPVLFVRGDDGVARVFMNRCTHRGSMLCQIERGNARAFTCPYHGWRFRTDGTLSAVPYSDRYGPDFNRVDYHLRPASRVAGYRGFVFASLAQSGISLEEHLGPLAMAEMDDVVDMAPDGILDVRAGVHKAGYAGNWKFLLENSMDGYHANFTHRSYFDVVEHRTGTDVKIHATSASPARIRDLGNGHSSWDVSAIALTSAQATQDDDAAAYRQAMIERHGRERALYLIAKKSVHLEVFPNLVFIGTHIRLIEPVRPDQTLVSLFPTLLQGAPKSVNTRRLRTHESFYGPAGGGAPDDLEIFARNQIGLGAGLDPWVLLARGLTLETRDAEGVMTGQMTDEIPQRAMWRQWRKVMSAAA
jgi:phenylpropionate dioxygenase-like ring-hydroxylating dioxygenase large terminal subunit